MNYITGVKEERERYVVKMDHFLKLGQIGTKLPPPPKERIKLLGKKLNWGRREGKIEEGKKGKGMEGHQVSGNFIHHCMHR